MKNALSISIVTPSLNQKKFIGQTIHSVLSQNIQQFEYIVIDGKSTDGTVDILKQYSKEKNFTWISEKDKGQANAINKGLKMATGDIVAYINSDDYYLPNTFTTVINYFTTHPKAMWLTGDCQIVAENGKEIQRCIRIYKKFFRLFRLYMILPILNPVAQPSTFWRREVMEKVGYFDETLQYTFDYDYWIRLIKIFPLFVIQRSLSVFRIHKASKGGTSYRRQFEEENMVMKKYIHNKIMVKLHTAHNALIVKIYSFIK